MSHVRAAAIAAAALILATAVLQVALAAGAPWGEHAYGGAGATAGGALSAPYRAASAVAAIVLVLAAVVVLARAEVVRPPLLGDRFVRWGTWAIVGFLVLNTVGNFASDSPFERWVMGSATLALVILCGFVALRAPASHASVHATTTPRIG